MHRIIYVVLSLAMCAALLGCRAAGDQTGKMIDETLFKGLPPEGDQSGPGWIICVVKKGEPVYQRAFGMADVEKKIPITSPMAFDIATLSRYFTGVTVVLLMENGALRLEDDIRTFIPEMPRRKDPITLEHLIYHTSGIPDYPEVMKKAGVEKAWDDLAVVDLLAEAELEFEPGSRHKTSSSNYFLLAFVVQRLTSMSMGERTTNAVFSQLGMEKSIFADHPDKQIENTAAGYRQVNGKHVKVKNLNLAIVGDTGLYTSIDELLIWEKALYEEKIGGDIFRGLIDRTGGALEGKQTIDYAFGLDVAAEDDRTIFSHCGAANGFSSAYLRCPQENLTVICLANLESIETGRHVKNVADIYLAR